MKTNECTEVPEIAEPEANNFLRLWGGLVQRTFPFMEEEVGELGPKARLFVTVCDWGTKRDARIDLDRAHQIRQGHNRRLSILCGRDLLRARADARHKCQHER